MLFEFNEEQSNFIKIIMATILPTPQQCQNQDAMRKFLDTCTEIRKILDRPIQPAGKPKEKVE